MMPMPEFREPDPGTTLLTDLERAAIVAQAHADLEEAERLTKKLAEDVEKAKGAKE